ncbi:MAG: SAM-dependent methyltransferase [Chlamydiales bacterium]|nr:SAM-dependent methyltransferase [Chlamydiia bacterium]MCP5507181.1 SAM-dependent methyltransferase [Chlamydiales bacterium]
MSKAALLLFPNVLGDVKHHEIFLPQSVDKAVATIDGLIAESENAGRRFLGRFETKKPAREIPIALYNEHSKDDDLDFLLEPIRNGERWGLVSDGGMPCVADPGSKLVFRAQKLGIAVQAFVGPSSIFLGLMLSGLPGQRFAFHGYISKENEQKRQQITQWEKRAKTERATQIFIEAPYRNKATLEALLETLSDNMLLCLAWDLTLPTQRVLTQTVEQWKKSPLPNIEKKPTLFLFNSLRS